MATYCEYQIKVKEQEFLDRMKEVTDACNHQLEESQLKMEASLQERVEKVGYNYPSIFRPIIFCSFAMMITHGEHSILYPRVSFVIK